MVKHSDNLALVAGARAGDRSSMSQLISHVRRRLHPYLRSLIANEDVSQDLMQEVLLTTVRSLHRLEAAENFWPWVYAIARNKIKSYLRNQCRMRSLLSAGFAEAYCYQRRQNSRDVSDLAVHRETQQVVLAALGRLEKQYRDVVQQHCLEEMSFSEIASAAGCSCQQVRTRFFRAKRSLRAKLSAASFLQE